MSPCLQQRKKKGCKCVLNLLSPCSASTCLESGVRARLVCVVMGTHRDPGTDESVATTLHHQSRSHASLSGKASTFNGSEFLGRVRQKLMSFPHISLSPLFVSWACTPLTGSPLSSFCLLGMLVFPSLHLLHLAAPSGHLLLYLHLTLLGFMSTPAS